MFDLGIQELILVFAVALLVFGPKSLPELSRTLGKVVRDLKLALRGVKDSFEEASSEVTDELKEVSDNMKDSIYKSVESNLEKEKKEEKTPDENAPEASEKERESVENLQEAGNEEGDKENPDTKGSKNSYGSDVREGQGKTE